LEINVLASLSQNAHISIVDMNARVVISKEMSAAKTELDIATLSKGIYFVKLIDEAGLVKTAKFIKE
jgi:hypothetical protein